MIDFGNGNFLEGNFSGDNLLVGTMMIDDKGRNFSCTNEARESNIKSITQAAYHFMQNNYFFRQDPL